MYILHGPFISAGGRARTLSRRDSSNGGVCPHTENHRLIDSGTSDSVNVTVPSKSSHPPK